MIVAQLKFVAHNIFRSVEVVFGYLSFFGLRVAKKPLPDMFHFHRFRSATLQPGCCEFAAPVAPPLRFLYLWAFHFLPTTALRHLCFGFPRLLKCVAIMHFRVSRCVQSFGSVSF
ncbi:unnamed protein product [Phaeothamnion confervicola]